jgi:hypothetical protein
MQPMTLTALVLKDGSRMFGTVEQDSGTEIVFRTHAGASVTVRRADVVSLKAVSGTIQAGEFLPPDPNATRLFFAPTGRSLKRGQVYLGVYEFLMPFVQVGVTDRFSVGGGTPLVLGIEDRRGRSGSHPNCRCSTTGTHRWRLAPSTHSTRMAKAAESHAPS